MQWDDRVGRRLRLKDLHTLQTVAAVGSMAKASERLALSQPAISKAISDMEQTLGAPLFDRSSSGVELTDCGRMLVERARVIFDEVRQGVLDIEHMSDPTRGEVRIGTIEPFTGVVSEIISQLVRRYQRARHAPAWRQPPAIVRDRRDACPGAVAGCRLSVRGMAPGPPPPRLSRRGRRLLLLSSTLPDPGAGRRSRHHPDHRAVPSGFACCGSPAPLWGTPARH